MVYEWWKRDLQFSRQTGYIEGWAHMLVCLAERKLGSDVAKELASLMKYIGGLTVDGRIDEVEQEEALVKLERLEDVKAYCDSQLRKARQEARATGRLIALERLAKRKFGPETAEELKPLLDGVLDHQRLGEVAALILDCASGEELLSRAAETESQIGCVQVTSPQSSPSLATQEKIDEQERRRPS